MDLLIKGMEMPKEGHLIIRIYASGEVCEPTECAGVWCKVATAVPVPPHGRLIDADKLTKQIKRDGIASDPFVRIVCNYFKDAPTVIPASKEGE